MASFTINWKPSALRELKALPKDMIARVVGAVKSLEANPHPPGSKKLTGSEHTYRIREDDYRVVYNVLAKQLLIEVIRVAHRRDVYS